MFGMPAMCLRLSSKRSGAPCPARLAWRERQPRPFARTSLLALIAPERGGGEGPAGRAQKRGKGNRGAHKGRRLSFKEK